MSRRPPDTSGGPEDDAPRLTRVLNDLPERSRAERGDGEEQEARTWSRSDRSRGDRTSRLPAAPADHVRSNEMEQRRRAVEGRVRELVNALGDPNHPQHAHAVAELVAIGPPAVPALGAALSPDRPWLTSYRAAEAIAQIGDGRASGSLINALRHPNSNVRWSVVRALAEVGDTRTLWALRRVVNSDRGKTSWGESVADTAQLALDRLQSRSALLRFSEPVKTAVIFVAMFAAILFAAERVQAVLGELRREVDAPALVFASTETTATADATSDAVAEAATSTSGAESDSSLQVTRTPGTITGTVSAASGNVRSSPALGDNVIGFVNQGDELIFLGVSGDWYLVRLGEDTAEASTIQGGRGWVSRIVVNEPSQRPPSVTPTRLE